MGEKHLKRRMVRFSDGLMLEFAPLPLYEHSILGANYLLPVHGSKPISLSRALWPGFMQLNIEYDQMGAASNYFRHPRRG